MLILLIYFLQHWILNEAYSHLYNYVYLTQKWIPKCLSQKKPMNIWLCGNNNLMQKLKKIIINQPSPNNWQNYYTYRPFDNNSYWPYAYFNTISHTMLWINKINDVKQFLSNMFQLRLNGKKVHSRVNRQIICLGKIDIRWLFKINIQIIWENQCLMTVQLNQFERYVPFTCYHIGVFCHIFK